MAKNEVNVRSLLSKGMASEKSGAYTQALACYSQILDRFPNNSKAKTAFKNLKSSQDKIPLESLSQSLVDNLSTLRMAGHLGQAKAEAEVLITAFPKNAFLQNFLGSMYLDAGDYDRAIELCVVEYLQRPERQRKLFGIPQTWK